MPFRCPPARGSLMTSAKIRSFYFPTIGRRNISPRPILACRSPVCPCRQQGNRYWRAAILAAADGLWVNTDTRFNAKTQSRQVAEKTFPPCVSAPLRLFVGFGISVERGAHYPGPCFPPPSVKSEKSVVKIFSERNDAMPERGHPLV